MSSVDFFELGEVVKKENTLPLKAFDFRPTVTVNLDAVQENYLFFQKKVGTARVAGVIKANAYGLGMLPVAQALWEVGCDTFFVTFLEEGVRVRRALPDAIIYVLEGGHEGQQSLYLRYYLRPVLGDLESLISWCQGAPHQPCALHIDTGMARTGFEMSSLTKVAEAFRSLEIESCNISMIMTHYASSEDLTTSQNQEQYQRFQQALMLLSGQGHPEETALKHLLSTAKTCLSNSQGVFLGASYWGDVVRVGFGISGLIDKDVHHGMLKPAVTVAANILQLRTIKVGQSVGYNATWRAEKTTRLATIGMGYADGVPRSLSNKGCFFWGDHILPIRGNVSMDFTVVDVTHISCDTLKVGDTVTFFHDSASLMRQSEAAETVGGEILSRLGPRCRRFYIRGK